MAPNGTSKGLKLPSSTIIVPLGLNDDTFINRCVVVSVLLKYDAVLETAKLKSTFDRLLQIPTWNKIGSRLRKKKNSRLEFHIPERFSPETPGYLWSLESANCSIKKHATGCHIPSRSGQACVDRSPDDLKSLIFAENFPKKLNDYLKSDVPPLAIRVVTFEDATTVAVSWPHILSDINGIRSVLDAWSLVLAGREKEIKPLNGFDFDPLEPLEVRGCPSDWVHCDYILSTSQKVRWIGRLAGELVTHRDFEWRTICLPSADINRLKESALKDMAQLNPSPAKPHFLSDGDVIVGFITQVLAASEPDRPLAIFCALSIRKIFPDIFPPDKVFIGNALSATVTTLPKAGARGHSISQIASRFRTELNIQATSSQQEALMAMTSAAYRKGRPPEAAVGDSAAKVLAFTNWTHARFFDTDFSGAGLTSSHAQIPGSTRAIGYKPTYVGQLETASRRPRSRYLTVIKGRDAEGNYWIDGVYRKPEWDAITRGLEEISQAANTYEESHDGCLC